MIGDPIGHSLSPAMHNAAFKKLGMNFVYRAFRVKAGELGKFAEQARKNLTGFNVTIPHKIEVMKYLDRVDSRAEKVGAVNTVVNRKGKLIGFNTDVSGVTGALKARKVSFRGKKVFVVGAGGAGRAAAFALAPEAGEVVLADRNEGKAAGLAADANKSFGKANVKSVPLGGMERELRGAGLLVNASSAGMKPNESETPVPKEFLNEKMAVMDAVYNPLKTRLIRDAESAGCRTVTGELMLVFQGAEAFRLFTGRKAPVKTMLETVRKRLGK